MKADNSQDQRLSGSGKEPEKDEGFIERLRHLAAIAGSANALAKKAGISQSGLQRYFAGGEPTRPVLQALADACNVSLDWLVLGKESEKGEPADQEYAYVSLYDARISSGHGAWNDSDRIITRLAFTRHSLRKQGLEPAHLVCVQNDGDSNEPILRDGATVMVDTRRNKLLGDAFYVVRLGDSLLAKRLQRQFDGGLMIISANPAYTPMHIPPERVEELEIVGRVVWTGSWLV